MSSIKKLASQTLWYGVSTIAARFLNYLLTPFLTYSNFVAVADFGKMSLIYSVIPFLNILFTYGMETTYFRFTTDKNKAKTVYNTISLSIIATTILFSLILWNKQAALSAWAGVSDVPILTTLTIFIVAFDNLNVIPFAKLREEGRPKLFAAIRVGGILVNVLATIFFIGYCPNALQENPTSWVSLFFNLQTNPIVWVLVANLLQSVVTSLLLTKQFLSIKLEFDFNLWKEMLIYSWPLVLVGLGAMINETFSRQMLQMWLPGDLKFKNEQVGIFNACYKLSVLITLFIQAFKMGAEPFFFKQTQEGNAQKTYARVMKFFVIVMTIMFLLVALFLPVWKYFVGSRYWAGISMVPILLLANIFLGIYYNLSIWYKLGKNTMAGGVITFIGVAITLTINYVFIPKYGFIACAWSTFFCYGSMMVVSYLWGQKVYPVPYVTKKLVAYLVIVVGLFFIQKGLSILWSNTIFYFVMGILLTLLYIRFIILVEKKEMQKLPFIGKWM